MTFAFTITEFAFGVIVGVLGGWLSLIVPAVAFGGKKKGGGKNDNWH